MAHGHVPRAAQEEFQKGGTFGGGRGEWDVGFGGGDEEGNELGGGCGGGKGGAREASGGGRRASFLKKGRGNKICVNVVAVWVRVESMVLDGMGWGGRRGKAGETKWDDSQSVHNTELRRRLNRYCSMSCV